MENNYKLVVVIPAYNEEKTIIEVINKIPGQIEGVDRVEVVVINDGSVDKTEEKVKAETKASVVSHYPNQGVGFSFRAGVNEALARKADIMVNIDADNQFDPKEISSLIGPILKKEADFVIGSRFINPSLIPRNMPKIKIWGNKKIARLISRLTGRKFHDISCGFRAYSRDCLLHLNLFGNFTHTQETIIDLSFKGLIIKEVPVKVSYFPDRKSRVADNLFNYAWRILKINFTTFRDYHPWKFFSLMGLLFFIMGLILDFFVFVYFLSAGTFTPYKSVIFAGGFLNIIGLLFLIVGLLADMLYRVRINQERMLYYEKSRHYGK